jgi:4-hydroxy-tetrahydrodipicolinate synthase
MSNTVDYRQKLQGVLPPIVTPFDEKGKFVRGGIAEVVEFTVGAGAHGMVVGGSTGEGHTLTTKELVEAVGATCEAAAGRVPVLAGLIVNSTAMAIERAKLFQGMGVTALQVTPVHYLFKPDADATVAHFKAIAEETGLPVIIYNVIPWNYLSVDLMLRIMDEVPGVIGMKQSNGDLKSLSDLLLRVKPHNIVVSGIDALLYSAFALGAHGAITALTAAVPGAIVKLWDLVKAGEHERARALHFRLNALWNSIRHDNLPACTKYLQHKQGVTLFHPRPPMERVSEAQKQAMDGPLAELLASL